MGAGLVGFVAGVGAGVVGAGLAAMVGVEGVVGVCAAMDVASISDVPVVTSEVMATLSGGKCAKGSDGGKVAGVELANAGSLSVGAAEGAGVCAVVGDTAGVSTVSAS